MKLLTFLLIGLIIAFVIPSVFAEETDLKSVELSQVVEQYNKFFDKVPGIVKSAIGTETIRAEIIFKDGAVKTAGLKTKKGLITDFQDEPYEDSTMGLYISEETIEKIISSDDPIANLKEAWGKEIRYEGLTFINQIKVFFMDIGFRLFSLFV